MYIVDIGYSFDMIAEEVFLRTFCMIPYNQRDAKITNTESFKLKSCMRKAADAIDKRFCFDIIPEDRWTAHSY